MTLTLPDLGATLAGVYRLDGSAFAGVVTMEHGVIYSAIAIVLFAGFSEAVAQSIVLFANKVKPGRFFFSWAIDAFLFAFGYGFQVASTWLVCRLPFAPHLTFRDLALIFGVSYAPLLFSFLGALPYIGSGILRVLRVWNFLAMVVGVSTVGGVHFIPAAGYVALGWAGYVIAQLSFGKPIAELGARMLDAVAGVKLVDDESAIIGRAESGSRQRPHDSSPAVAAHAPAHPNAWKIGLATFGVLVLALLVIAVFDPVRDAMFGWESGLPAAVAFPLNLLWLAVPAIVFAGLMAPMETLGWWAGWYGDRIDTSGIADVENPADAGDPVTRYIIYLDGIAQSSSQYTPDIETFLDTLTPELPAGTCLIRGVMVYSAMNRPLEDDPIFSRFWKVIDALRLSKTAASLLGMFINLRNVMIVGVSADSRYGPMYNFGIAQVMFRSLVAHGYRPGSGVPVTLIGYSGGGQMACGAAQFLKHAIDGPLDVISLGGVIDGDDPILDLEHLFHLVGDKDNIERIGPVMFPSRWKIAPLSYWNRARRLGRLTQISLGPVGHQVPGGMLDPDAKLPDGRTNLRQTLDYIGAILSDQLTVTDPALKRKTSNYELYAAAPFNQPAFYPLDKRPSRNNRYAPAAPWIGRLILPKREERFGGALFEVHAAPDEHAPLIGRVVKLVWNDEARGVKNFLRVVRRDVSFSAQAYYSSSYGGLVLPERVNRWRLVDPLESLAGSHPADDTIVKLAGTVTPNADRTALAIERQPVQITGRWYALVRFLGPGEEDGTYRVVHYDPDEQNFGGGAETIRVPSVVADAYGLQPSVALHIESSPLNAEGWYVYGAPDASGTFVVQSLAPRGLVGVRSVWSPLEGERPYRYVRKRAWRDVVANKGGCVATSLSGDPWKAGDVALLLHTYGGIGGAKGEAAASGPFYFGHFAYGIAEVIEDPLSRELRFEITYYQVYAHNVDGLIAGPHDWSRYMGDRQFGWAGVRPVCDILLRHDAFDRGALETLRGQLEAMTARYRIGDGTGSTYTGPANNCSQDSNRALFGALRALRRTEGSGSLHRIARDLRRKLQPFGGARHDWSTNEYNLGSTIEDAPLHEILMALGSWRCIVPRLAVHSIAATFLADGASAWVLGSDAIGGERRDIEPVVPLAL